MQNDNGHSKTVDEVGNWLTTWKKKSRVFDNLTLRGQDINQDRCSLIGMLTDPTVRTIIVITGALASALFQQNGTFIVFMCDVLGHEFLLTKQEETSPENAADCVVHSCNLRFS